MCTVTAEWKENLLAGFAGIVAAVEAVVTAVAAVDPSLIFVYLVRQKQTVNTVGRFNCENLIIANCKFF